MLMLARRATEQQQTFRDCKLGTPLGLQMHGKTLGIIGMGNIGANQLFPANTYRGPCTSLHAKTVYLRM